MVMLLPESDNPSVNINTQVTGALVVRESGGDKMFSTDNGASWRAYAGTLTITGSGTQTSNIVRIQSGTHSIALSGVNIAAANSAAISCEGATVSLELAAGTVNTLQGGGDNGSAGYFGSRSAEQAHDQRQRHAECHRR